MNDDTVMAYKGQKEKILINSLVVKFQLFAGGVISNAFPLA